MLVSGSKVKPGKNNFRAHLRAKSATQPITLREATPANTAMFSQFAEEALLGESAGWTPIVSSLFSATDLTCSVLAWHSYPVRPLGHLENQTIRH